MAYIRTQKEIKNKMDYLNLVNSIINTSSNFTKTDILKSVRYYSKESGYQMTDEELGKMINDSVDLLYHMGKISYKDRFKWK